MFKHVLKYLIMNLSEMSVWESLFYRPRASSKLGVVSQLFCSVALSVCNSSSAWKEEGRKCKRCVH